MTLAELLKYTSRRLKDVNIETASLDARLLIQEVTGFDRTQITLKRDDVISKEVQERLEILVRRRLNYEPVSRILGVREFWSLEFKITEDVLDPRADTELLIEIALEFTKKNKEKPWSIADLGTGSGCIILSMLSELPKAQGLAVDVSKKALAVAKENAENLNLANRCQFQSGGWASLEAQNKKFDIILSNPPYISDDDILELMPDVKRFDPNLALSGGADGLNCYRQLSKLLLNVLHEEGLAVFEIGFNQAEQVSEIFNYSGLTSTKVLKDLAGHDRAIVVQYRKK